MKKALLVAALAALIGANAAAQGSSTASFYAKKIAEEAGFTEIIPAMSAVPCGVHAALWDTVAEKDKADGTDRYYAERTFTFAYETKANYASTARIMLDVAGLVIAVRYRSYDDGIKWVDEKWRPYLAAGDTRSYRGGDGQYIDWLVGERGGKVYICATGVVLLPR